MPRLAALLLCLASAAAIGQTQIDLATGVLRIDDLLVKKADGTTVYADATLSANPAFNTFTLTNVLVVPAPGVNTSGLAGEYGGTKFVYQKGTLTPATGSCAVPGGFNGSGTTTLTIGVVGSAITINQVTFANDVCQFTGTVSNGVASGTFQCSSFNDGTWSSSVMLNTSANTLLAQISIDGDDCDYDAHYLGFRR